MVVMKKFNAIVGSNPGESVNRPRYAALLLLFILMFSTSVSADGSSSDDAYCGKLITKYERGFLTRRERSDYCLHSCKFLKVDCSDGSRSLNTVSVDIYAVYTKLNSFVDSVLAGAYDELGDTLFNPTVDEATIDAWLTMTGRLWTVLLCFIPILLNQWKYYNYLTATAFMVAFLAMCCTGYMPVSIALHNAVVAMLAMMHSSNSGHLVENVWTSVLVLIPIFSLFIVDPLWHLFILVGTFIGFLAYLQWCFFTKRSGVNAGAVVVIAQMFMVAEQMWFVKSEMGERSLGGASIEAALNAIIPSGRSAMLTFNVSANAINIAKRMPFNMSAVITYLVVFILQMIMFVGFRASLGAFYLHVLRYRTDVRSLASGFFVYSADFFGPSQCLFRMVFGYESHSSRRFMYMLVGMILQLYEGMYAREFALFRLVVSFFDAVFFKSRYGRMTHYLSIDLDFMQAAFPHVGAPPWFPIADLAALSRYTGVLLSKNAAGDTVRGLGVILNSANRTMLYSVKHVIRGSTLVQFMNESYSSPDFEPVTKGFDPFVAMKIAPDSEAPNIDILTPFEVGYVKQLIFINRSNEGDPYACVVPKFVVKDGALSAIVNLRKGDSGGPCFALLESGGLRMCGAVSRGNPRNGGGNIISFCYSDNEMGANSSDDEDLSEDRAMQFNKVRRVKHASDDPESHRYKCAASLKSYIDGHADEIKTMLAWNAHFTWADLDADEDLVISRVYDADAGLENRVGVDDNDDFQSEDNPSSGKKNKRADAKRRNKDRAYRKRQLDMMKIIGEKLKHIYSENDARNIFDNMARGHRPIFSPREFIASGDGESWNFVDALPDPDW